MSLTQSVLCSDSAGCETSGLARPSDGAPVTLGLLRTRILPSLHTSNTANLEELREYMAHLCSKTLDSVPQLVTTLSTHTGDQQSSAFDTLEKRLAMVEGSFAPPTHWDRASSWVRPCGRLSARPCRFFAVGR